MAGMSLEPIVFDLELLCSPAQAFDAFAVHMGEWWDGRYSADADTFTGIEVEPALGGSVVFVHADGQRYAFGIRAGVGRRPALRADQRAGTDRGLPQRDQHRVHSNRDGLRGTFRARRLELGQRRVQEEVR
jgi:hypothetical protein